jgi:hypothetical protein
MRVKPILCALLALLVLAPAAKGAPSDPLFVFTPAPPRPPAPIVPAPTGNLNGPCGLAVDSSGRYYVSDYYHHAVDVFAGTGYIAQLAKVDPLDGPCGLAVDSANRLYVNDYHRDVSGYGAFPSFGAATVFPLPVADAAHHLPTGVAVDPLTDRVYVNHRTYVAVYDSAGNLIEEAGQPLLIGQGSLGDGYGVAVSQFPGTLGRIYVPDASSNTVKVYDPLLSKSTPVAEIKDPFNKAFVSLRDSAIAVDRRTGEIYFADNLQPAFSERPQASIYVYSPTDSYKGRLKYNIVDALPPGLAVDNSNQFTQGSLYVTSGNTEKASIYAYGPGSATLVAPLPPLGTGLSAPGQSSGVGARPDLSEGPSPSSDFGSDKDASQATNSVITQEDNLRLSVEGKLLPKRLPRAGTAPISVSIGWQIATTDGSAPPKLKTLRIEINKEGRFETQGLPICPYAKIQPATTQRALSNCGSALVGRGSFAARIALKGQEGEGYEASGKLLVFNGRVKGKPVLFGHIYAARPFATSFVITFELERLAKGTYGTVLSAELPMALRSWGDLTSIQMSLSRRYSYAGKRHSFISAGCPAPKGFGLASFKLARTAFAFTGGKELFGTVLGSCRAR